MTTNTLHKQRTAVDMQHDIVVNAHFFRLYKAELKGLFAALGREREWSDNPRDMLPYLREKWIGMEHGNHDAKDQFTKGQIAAAQPYLEKMGLKGSQYPSPGEHFDQVVIGGGTMLTNYRRIELVDELLDMGVKIDKVVFWLGRRPAGDRDGTPAELLATTGKLSGNNVRRNPWVKDLMKRGALKLRGTMKLTETDLGRMAILKVFDGMLMPYRVDLSALNEKRRRTDLLDMIERTPEEFVTDYYFETDDGLEIVLLNGKPVHRGAGPNGELRPHRPTTASTTAEWLERHAPVRDARVLYVTGNPHMLRMAQDSYAVMQRQGRGDINLQLACIAPAADMDIHTYLGEIARLIDNDVKRNYGRAWQ